MSALAHRQSLDQLAATIHREHALAMQAGRSMIDHAIRAGEALLEAQRQVEWGHWEAWLADNFPQSRDTAFNYMRLAHHRDLVEGAESIVSALRMLKSLTLDEEPRSPRPVSAIKVQALEFAASGLGAKEIAEQLGISVRSVHGHLRQRGATDTRYRERKATQKTQARVTADALKLLRATAARLGELHALATTSDLREALQAARSRVEDAETHLAEATDGRAV